MRSPLNAARRAAFRKRSEALASIQLRRKEIERLTARVAELDAEIDRLGGPAKPRTQTIPSSQGVMQRALFDLLRERGSATSAELAALVIERMGLDAGDGAVVARMRGRASLAFKRCERRELVRCIGGVGKSQRPKQFALPFP